VVLAGDSAKCSLSAPATVFGSHIALFVRQRKTSSQTAGMFVSPPCT
jgi:hypothetical protein